MQGFIHSPDTLLANFYSEKGPRRLILITGPSGSGKTRWCLELAEAAYALGIRRAGLVSPAILERGEKTGIDLLNIASGAVRRLAYRHGEIANGTRVGDWIFDDETINWGNDILMQAVDSPLLIIDELGPLEFDKGYGFMEGFPLIEERNYCMACVVVRPLFLKHAIVRWPWAQSLEVKQFSNIGAGRE